MENRNTTVSTRLYSTQIKVSLSNISYVTYPGEIVFH